MTIEDLLRERAESMAAHDGAPAATVAHLHGAANQLQAELLRARDDLLRTPHAPEAPLVAEEGDPPEGGTERAAETQPQPEPEPEPALEPEPAPAAEAEAGEA